MVMQRLCSYIWLRWLGSWLWVGCRYCVLLITGDDPAYLAANKAFLDFASANSKDVLRFAYVYQRQQQPLCQALLQNQGAHSAQVSGQNTHSPYFTKAIPKVKSSAARLKTRKSFLVAVITAAHPGQRFGNHCFATIITFLSVIATKKTKPQGHPALFGKPTSYTQNNLQWKISLIRCVTLPICAD